VAVIVNEVPITPVAPAATVTSYFREAYSEPE
jgi:hypothetical protein